MNEETHSPGPVEVFRSHRARRVKETGLVLQAMGIPFETAPLGAEAALLVQPTDAGRPLGFDTEPTLSMTSVPW